MRYKRYIILITPIVIWLLSWAYLMRADLFYYVLASGAFLILISVKLVDYSRRNNWPLFAITPVLLFLSLALYSAIIISSFWIKAIFFVSAAFLFVYFKHLYYFFNSNDFEEAERRAGNLDNLIIAAGFLISFSVSAVWFGLPAFLNWPPVYTLPILATVILLLFVQFSFFSPNKSRPLGLTAFLIVLGLIEVAWALSLLPLNFNILGLFMSIYYYFGLTALRLKWSGSLNRESVKLPLALSAAVIFLLFITARWL